jgi:hypothetical protein
MHREIEGRGENIEDLLKKLLEISSIKASLHLKLATKLDEAKTEVIRLSGLLSMCELKEKNLNRYRAIVKEMINKYVMEIKHNNS